MKSGDEVTVAAKGDTIRHTATLLAFNAGGQTCYPVGGEPYVAPPTWQVRINGGYYDGWLVSIEPSDIKTIT